MSTHAPAGAGIPRFSEQEPIARDVKTELLEPDTEEEYLERRSDLDRIKSIQTCLFLIDHHLRQMSVSIRDEVEGRTGLDALEMHVPLRGIAEARKELQAGLIAFEGRVP